MGGYTEGRVRGTIDKRSEDQDREGNGERNTDKERERIGEEIEGESKKRAQRDKNGMNREKSVDEIASRAAKSSMRRNHG